MARLWTSITGSWRAWRWRKNIREFWNANVDRYEARRAQGDIFVHEWETDLPEDFIPEVDKEEDSCADVKVEDEE